MKKIGFITWGIVLAGVLMSGCSNTGTNVPPSNQADASGTVIATEQQNGSTQTITLDNVLNHQETPESAFKYVEREEGIEIQGCTSTDEIIVVPETINGIKVTSIDDSAFSDIKKTVRGLYISNNVEHVDGYSLCNYENLEILVLGENINDLPRAYILNNKNLQYIQFMCPKIKNMAFGAVNGCEALKGIYFLGDVENIEANAFLVKNVTIYGKKNSNLQKAVEKIDSLTFQAIE